jgi:segregation and condensation protein A
MQTDVEFAEKRTVFATIAGEPLTEIPADLFIPPDALEVLLESFSGPLDLLLYLIRRQNFDIMNIPIAMITRQYMQYIDLMELRRLELAADYLVMAAMLAEIKARLLLPREPSAIDPGEEDPRMELVRRLQEYEQFKVAATLMDGLIRCERDVSPIRVSCDQIMLTKPLPHVELSALVLSMTALLAAQSHSVSHPIQREILSVRARMGDILTRIQAEQVLNFKRLYLLEEGRMGIVVSLLAILELAKQSLLIIIQTEPYAPILIKANQHQVEQNG